MELAFEIQTKEKKWHERLNSNSLNATLHKQRCKLCVNAVRFSSPLHFLAEHMNSLCEKDPMFGAEIRPMTRERENTETLLSAWLEAHTCNFHL